MFEQQLFFSKMTCIVVWKPQCLRETLEPVNWLTDQCDPHRHRQSTITHSAVYFLGQSLHVAKNGLANLKRWITRETLMTIQKVWGSIELLIRQSFEFSEFNKGALEELCAVIGFCVHMERTGFNEW